MKKIYENHKGITLIALIITIIVLLILAGITIAAISGNEGVLNKAQNAKSQTDIANAKDAASLKATEYIQDFYHEKYITNTTDANTVGEYVAERFETQVQSGIYYIKTDEGTMNLKVSLDAAGSNVVVTGTIQNDGTINWSDETSGITAEEQGKLAANNMQELTGNQITNENLKNNPNVKTVLTGNIPIPTGYTYVCGTGTTQSTVGENGWGVVIEDESHNEYVWVPVNAEESKDTSEVFEDITVNNKMGKTIESIEKTTGLKLASLNGLEGIIGIKVAENESESEEPEPETETETDEQIAKNTTVGTKTKGEILKGINRGYPASTSSTSREYREPALVTNYDLNSINYTQAGFHSATEMAQALKKDYEDMVESIKQYGGFYVGRYELTGSEERPTVQANQNAMNRKNWHQLYQACTKLKEENSSVMSTMMWGAQWDLMCLWSQKKGDKVSYSIYDSNRHTGDYARTGNNNADKRNNIYDVEGNYYEWTQEAFYVDNRAYRGSNCSIYSNGDNSASQRGSLEPDFCGGAYTSRPSLYIKQKPQSKLDGIPITSQNQAKDYYGTTVARIDGIDYGLFYIDFEGKYSGGVSGAGTVYLRAKQGTSTTGLYSGLTEEDKAAAVSIMKQLNPDWRDGNRGNIEYSSMQRNEKGTAYLCNPNNSLWVGTASGTATDPSILKWFKNKYGASNVNYIIGAPSLELYLASYNAKYNSGYSAVYRESDQSEPGYSYLNVRK